MRQLGPKDLQSYKTGTLLPIFTNNDSFYSELREVNPMNSSIESTESERLTKVVQNPISNIHKRNHFIKNDKTNQTNLPNVVYTVT